MQRVNRRRFLYLTLGAGASLGSDAIAYGRYRRTEPPAAGDTTTCTLRNDLQAVTRKSRALGSQVSITALHSSSEVARRAVDSALAEISLVDELMSIYRPGSQLAVLNRRGVLDEPHPYLRTVLCRARALSRRTKGAFDVTVQPLWEVYAEAKKAESRPEKTAVEAALKRVDWRQVELAATRVELLGRGTAVTLNGIAQGFAADRAMAALRRHGVRHALVNTGEIGTLGEKTEGEPWTVGVQHPRREDAYLSLAGLRGRCLATSGDYATSFSEDHREHHIFDPRSGRSPGVFSSVSVAAATATEADALSTAVFVLGLEEGLALLRFTPGADALLVLKDGRTLSTDGFPIRVGDAASQ